MKLSDEDRVNIVKKILEGRSTAWRTSRETGIAESYIKRLVNRAKRRGLSSLLHKKYKREYSPQEKYDMVLYAIRLGSTDQAAAHFDVEASSLLRWRRALEEEGFEALAAMKIGRPPTRSKKNSSDMKKKKPNDKDLLLENEKLKKELEQARMENDFLKKLDALVRGRIRRESSNSSRPSKS